MIGWEYMYWKLLLSQIHEYSSDAVCAMNLGDLGMNNNNKAQIWSLRIFGYTT